MPMEKKLGALKKFQPIWSSHLDSYHGEIVKTQPTNAKFKSSQKSFGNPEKEEIWQQHDQPGRA